MNFSSPQVMSLENNLYKQIQVSNTVEPDVEMDSEEDYSSIQLKERIKQVKSRALESPSKQISEN